MKKAWMILALSLGLPSIAGAKAKIEEVVVFADRAEVTRAVSVQCLQNKGRAQFESLPESLDVRTLRGESSAGEVIGTASELVLLEESADKKVAALEKEHEALNELIENLESEQSAVAARQAQVRQYSQLASDVLSEAIRNPKPEPKRWGQTLDRFAAEHRKLATEQAALSKKLHGHYANRRKLEKRILQAGPKASKRERRAEVTIECGGKQRVKVKLSYVVPGARWGPEYDLRFSPPRGQKVGRGQATLTIAAVIQQSTGEDWSGVKLHLSTAKPKLGSEAPYPAPLYVNGHERRDGKVLVQAKEERKSLKRSGGQPSQASGALEDGGHSFILKIPHKVSIVSDGRPYWVPVEVLKAKATAKLLAIPKLTPYVYQVVEFENPAPYPLLEGRVHSYRRNTFVGDTSLEYHGIGEPMRISLGRDEELKIERKTVQKKKRKAGTLSWTQHLEQSYEISVTNQAAKAQTVYVQENIPISKSEEIEVELLKETTPGYEHDKERGFLTWTLKLGRSQKKAISLGYHIHLPDDWKVR